MVYNETDFILSQVAPVTMILVVVMEVMKLLEALVHHPDGVQMRLNHLQHTQRVTMKVIVNLEQFRQLEIKHRLLLSSIIMRPLNTTLIMVIIQPILTQHMVIIMDIHIGIINKKHFREFGRKCFLYSLQFYQPGCSIR